MLFLNFRSCLIRFPTFWIVISAFSIPKPDSDSDSDSEALLIPVVENGKLIYELPNLDEIQQFYLSNIKKLPDKYKSLDENSIFKLKISKKLSELINSLTEKFT
jgi:hypothetical protein